MQAGLHEAFLLAVVCMYKKKCMSYQALVLPRVYTGSMQYFRHTTCYLYNVHMMLLAYLIAIYRSQLKAQTLFSCLRVWIGI